MEIRYYQTANGRKPFVQWLENLRDRKARLRILERLARGSAGNFGNVRSVGEGVFELKVDWGPGYRVYHVHLGTLIVLLLCAGDKKTQTRDIERAKAYFKDYKART